MKKIYLGNQYFDFILPHDFSTWDELWDSVLNFYGNVESTFMYRGKLFNRDWVKSLCKSKINIDKFGNLSR